MYAEMSSTIGGAVLWRRSMRGDAAPVRVLPDGCIDLIWSDRVGLFVAGPDTTAHLATGAPGERYVGLRLPPGTGPAVLGIPAYELRDRRVPLASIWPERPARVGAERAALARHPGRSLEAIALARLRGNNGPDPSVAALVALLDAGQRVTETAAELGWGTRLLHRRCRTLFGYGPKTLARILRLRRALALVRSGVPAAEAAARAGYADQPHLSHDVRALAGVPLGDLVRPDDQPSEGAGAVAKRSTPMPSGSSTAA